MYRALFQNILYPIYESGLRRRNTLRYKKIFERNQWLSKDELLANQWKELEKLLKHAYQNSSYYRELFDELHLHPADIRTYDDFRQIPVCSREDVAKHHERMIADNYRSSIMRKGTGGSTGVPVQFGLDRDSYEWRTALTQRGYSWANCEAGQHTLYLWSVDVGNPSFLSEFKTNLYHRFFNRKMFNLFDLTQSEMNRCVSYINRTRPRGIVAYTTAIYDLATYISENGIDVRPVKSVITGAEKLYEHQRELIERVFRTRVFNTYGCREFMLIAAECEQHNGLHLSIDNLFVEVMAGNAPASPGESGDIVITDLHNYGMPFIRYRNGDLVTLEDRQCECGRGLPLIKDIDGRRLDQILATNGKALTGVFFPHLMKELPEVEKFQVIQKDRKLLLIKLVSSAPLAEPRKNFCQTEIRKVTGDDMQIEFEYVNEIPLTPSGKYRVTVSELNGN